MSTANKLNKISRILRQQGGYYRKFLCASTLLSLIALPTLAAQENENQVESTIEVVNADGEVEVIEVYAEL